MNNYEYRILFTDSTGQIKHTVTVPVKAINPAEAYCMVADSSKASLNKLGYYGFQIEYLGEIV